MIQNEVLSAIAARRSCRAYQPEQIKPEELDAVLQAGTWAPTGMNRQSPVIVAVQDKETRDRLSAINAAIMGSNGDPFYGAPTVLVVLADRSVHTHVEDGSLVLGDLLLAASSIGLGSCWIHRAKETFETEEGKEMLRKWGLDPDKYVGVGNCILGYPAPGGVKAATPRKADYVVKA
ncbi:nitroreductase [Subdoligranulum variabile]|uniref:Nitroreductase family protein n=1 Tax=Subdoligranulum variabile DSM 15176 TaxID=411471 RepID=D1PLP9_9FIRM|nr:nitroreductase [Subdoligranulum variabile]EFB76347.1 nitroreductase family protein [Subdoligranulum variabile DSM 15176]UWP67909.1 nitroreductase [Subdoligranulum variabile]